MGQRGSTQPEARVLILGLDNAGKSTLLYKMKHDKLVGTVPTVGFNVEMFDVKRKKKNFALTVWDVDAADKYSSLLCIPETGVMDIRHLK
uniref:ADP-ribosylation factor-like 14 n=1 Tax=Hippocampus comes TaxID=109280 RepID=A0A3Q2XTI6_HIPCM